MCKKTPEKALFINARAKLSKDLELSTFLKRSQHQQAALKALLTPNQYELSKLGIGAKALRSRSKHEVRVRIGIDDDSSSDASIEVDFKEVINAVDMHNDLDIKLLEAKKSLRKPETIVMTPREDSDLCLHDASKISAISANKSVNFRDQVQLVDKASTGSKESKRSDQLTQNSIRESFKIYPTGGNHLSKRVEHTMSRALEKPQSKGKNMQSTWNSGASDRGGQTIQSSKEKSVHSARSTNSKPSALRLQS